MAAAPATHQAQEVVLKMEAKAWQTEPRMEAVQSLLSVEPPPQGSPAILSFGSFPVTWGRLTA